MSSTSLLRVIDLSQGVREVVSTLPKHWIFSRALSSDDFELDDTDLPLTIVRPGSQSDENVVFVELAGQNKEYRPYEPPGPEPGGPTRPHALVSGSHNVCEACEDIEVQRILNNPQGVYYELGWYRDVVACRSCSLCRLLTHAFEANLNIQKTKVANARVSNCFIILECLPAVTPLPAKRRERAYELHAMLIDATERNLRGSARLRPLASSASTLLRKSKLFHARKVDPEAADLDLARIWIDECCNTHDCGGRRGRQITQEAESQSSAILPSFESRESTNDGSIPESEPATTPTNRNAAAEDELRVIDTENDCLTFIPRSEEYVTLSYVWPRLDFEILRLLRENRERLHRPKALGPMRKMLPKVIRDAMDVVMRLGERYLWVDALCITQDDDVEKASLISIMDQVYGNSFLTLVVATANPPINDYGIPGVNGTPRTARQHMSIVDDLDLVTALPGSSQALEGSVWYTRGWTFQEGVLSKRCLIFTDQQIFFRCPQDARSEDVHGEGCQAGLKRHPAMPDGQNGQMDYITGQKFLRNAKDGYVFREYALLAFGYSRRNFSFEDDILNGFWGILTTLVPHLPGPKDFFVGLPLSHFDQALLWYPTSHLERRRFATFNGTADVPLPSWSWMAWKGSIAYEKDPDRLGDSRALSTMVQWWVPVRQGELVPLRNYNPKVTAESAFSHGLLVASARNLSPNHLVCWASFARFRVSRQEKPLREWLTDWRQRLPCFTLLDQDGDACGMLPSVDRNWANSHKTSRDATTTEYPFMLLSYIEQAPVNATTAHAIFFHPKYNIPLEGENRHKCFHNVMLLEHGADGIAYRLGVGRVHVDAVNQQLESSFAQRVILG